MFYEGRPVLSCKHCGYAYAGRGIFADHGLAQYNLRSHEEVCLQQQANEKARAARRYRREMERKARKAGIGSAPMVGQLGFPWDGVPAIIEG